MEIVEPIEESKSLDRVFAKLRNGKRFLDTSVDKFR